MISTQGYNVFPRPNVPKGADVKRTSLQPKASMMPDVILAFGILWTSIIRKTGLHVSASLEETAVVVASFSVLHDEVRYLRIGKCRTSFES
jgi:hypothetical protein